MKKYRFFGGLLKTQEKWLNKMSAKGFRLVSVPVRCFMNLKAALPTRSSTA